MRTSLLALLLISACASDPGFPPDCRDIAEADPTVRELEIKSVTNAKLQAETQGPLREARARAASACLQSHGLLAPGGVERRRNPDAPGGSGEPVNPRALAL